MKLHALIIQEEAIELKLAEDLWKENKVGVSTFIPNTIYFVRKVDGKDQYEVMVETPDHKRQAYAKVSKTELDASFVPVRAKDTPDAEGYTQYRDANEVQAFKYSGDTIKLDLTGKGLETPKILDGDYLVQKSDANNFTYSIEKAKNFENLYAKK